MNKLKYHDLKIRIPYADVDQMGVVYYSNYLVYFERGRTEFFRDVGLEYKKMEDDFKLFLPVREAYLNYLAPGRYDDLLNIKTWIKEIRRASMVFGYDITNQNDILLVQGHTAHVFVNRQFKPERIPADMIKKMSEYIKK